MSKHYLMKERALMVWWETSNKSNPHPGPSFRSNRRHPDGSMAISHICVCATAWAYGDAGWVSNHAFRFFRNQNAEGYTNILSNPFEKLGGNDLRFL